MTQPDPLDAPTLSEQSQLDRAKKPLGWAARYPKPDQADIEEMYSRLKPAFDRYFTLVQENRDVRYLQDELPQKWRRRLQGSRRFRSRLSHNETLRIAAFAALKIQPSQKKHNYNLFATLLIPFFNIGTLKLISNPSLH